MCEIIYYTAAEYKVQNTHHMRTCMRFALRGFVFVRPECEYGWITPCGVCDALWTWGKLHNLGGWVATAFERTIRRRARDIFVVTSGSDMRIAHRMRFLFKVSLLHLTFLSLLCSSSPHYVFYLRTILSRGSLNVCVFLRDSVWVYLDMWLHIVVSMCSGWR